MDVWGGDVVFYLQHAVLFLSDLELGELLAQAANLALQLLRLGIFHKTYIHYGLVAYSVVSITIAFYQSIVTA